MSRVTIAFVLSICVKWARALILLCLLFIQTVGVVRIEASPGDESIVEITFTPGGTVLSAPTDFTATKINDYKIRLNWTNGAGASGVVIVANPTATPMDLTDGYIVFNGTASTVDDTDVDFNFWTAEQTQMFYRAVSVNENGSVSLPAYTEIVEVNLMTVLIAIVILMGLAGIAYWREDWIVYLISGITLLTFGGYYVATANYIGIALIFFGLYTAYRGLALRRR